MRESTVLQELIFAGSEAYMCVHSYLEVCLKLEAPVSTAAVVNDDHGTAKAGPLHDSRKKARESVGHHLLIESEGRGRG